MHDIKVDLKQEIERFFGIQKQEITAFRDLKGTNHVYSFTVKNQKYVVKKPNDSSIVNWENERDAYNALKPLDITDELVYYGNCIKITKFIDNSETFSFGESDLIDALDKIRIVHESGVSIKYNHDIIGNMDHYIKRCSRRSRRLSNLIKNRSKIEAIQATVNKLNIPPVLCHGDAVVTANFLRLPDTGIRIIDWEHAGMADPLLDVAFAALRSGLENVDPVWCLHHYLKRVPDKQEYLRLFSFLALDSYSSMAWCIYENPGDYGYYLNAAIKYSELVLNFYSL